MENKKLVIKPKRAKGDDGYRVFSIRIREDIVSQIDKIALQTGHSRNELVSMLLEFGLENCVVEQTSK